MQSSSKTTNDFFLAKNQFFYFVKKNTGSHLIRIVVNNYDTERLDQVNRVYFETYGINLLDHIKSLESIKQQVN
jgi:hypothetical protein